MAMNEWREDVSGRSTEQDDSDEPIRMTMAAAAMNRPTLKGAHAKARVRKKDGDHRGSVG